MDDGGLMLWMEGGEGRVHRACMRMRGASGRVTVGGSPKVGAAAAALTVGPAKRHRRDCVIVLPDRRRGQRIGDAVGCTGVCAGRPGGRGSRVNHFGDPRQCTG